MKLILLLTLFLSQFSLANDGYQIMKKVDERDTGKDLIAAYTMKIINGDKAKERELLWWRKNLKTKVYNLIKIKEPNMLKNTGLMIHSNKADKDDTWLFLSKAAKKEPRKIGSSNKDSKFLGSEFYYVDFEENGVDEFNHKFLRDEKLGDKDCSVVESIAKDSEYTYSKLISYIDKSNNVAIKVELFRKNELEKIFTVMQIEKVDNIWTIKKSLMDNIKEKKQTEMTLNKIQYNKGFKDSFFSLASLIRDI